VKLKEITKEEVVLFMSRLNLEVRSDYSQEQAEVVGTEVMQNDGVFSLIDEIMRDKHLDAVTKVVTTFVGAFQMGRQFELYKMMNSIRKEINNDKKETQQNV